MQSRIGQDDLLNSQVHRVKDCDISRVHRCSIHSHNCTTKHVMKSLAATAVSNFMYYGRVVPSVVNVTY